MKESKPYHDLSSKMSDIIVEKQTAYGDSFGNSQYVMNILYPNGISRDQMGDALTVVRIVDKLFRVANQKDAFGESPFKDIMGYAMLAVVRDDKDKALRASSPYRVPVNKAGGGK